nr:MAG TPA: hypothetical protein [Caudoviricetes sp.]
MPKKSPPFLIYPKLIRKASIYLFYHIICKSQAKNENKNQKSPPLHTSGAADFLRIYPYLHFPKIIPRHIPCDILPDWCPAAIRRRSGDAVAPQLARHAVVDVVRSGGQPGSWCGGSFVGEQRYIAADVHRLAFLPGLRLCWLRCCCGLGGLEPVQPFLADDCRIVRVALVHVHITPNAAHLACAGLLPDAVLSVVGGLIHAVVCHPDSIPCPQLFCDAVFQMYLAGVNPHKIARLFYSFKERLCNGGAGCLALCKHTWLLDVKIHGVLERLALDNAQANSSFFSCLVRCGCVRIPVHANRHTVGLAAGVIVFKLRVFLRCLLAVARTDNGKLHTVCLDVRPVHSALMLRYIDSFHTHSPFPFDCNNSIAFVITVGSGTPSSPAFSVMEISSLTVNAMHTASLMYDVPKVISRRTATRTSSRETHFFAKPRQPILLDSLPVSDFGDLPQAATASPVI